MLVSIAKFIGVKVDQLAALQTLLEQDPRIRSKKIKKGKLYRAHPIDEWHVDEGNLDHKGFPWAKMLKAEFDSKKGTYTVQVGFLMHAELDDVIFFNPSEFKPPASGVGRGEPVSVSCPRSVISIVCDCFGPLGDEEFVKGSWQK